MVLRGLDAIPEFLRAKDNDYWLAKASFIAAFVAEMKENTGAEANAALAEGEGLICDDNGLVVVGIFPTGGQCPDAILADCILSRTELESGNALGAFLQTPSPVLDKISGPIGRRNFYPVLGWGSAPS